MPGNMRLNFHDYAKDSLVIIGWWLSCPYFCKGSAGWVDSRVLWSGESSLLRHLVVRMISIGSCLFPSWTTLFLCNQIVQRVVKTVWRKNILSWCRSLFLKMQSVSKLSIEMWAISEVLIAKEEQTKQLWPRGIKRIGVRMILSLPCTWDSYCT